MRLATYVNSVHPLDPVFDAVIVHGGGRKIRTDLKIKIWKLNSETDVIIGQAAARQPDTANFRIVGSCGRFARGYAVYRQPVEARGTRREPDCAGLHAGAARRREVQPAPAPQLAAGQIRATSLPIAMCRSIR